MFRRFAHRRVGILFLAGTSKLRGSIPFWLRTTKFFCSLHRLQLGRKQDSWALQSSWPSCRWTYVQPQPVFHVVQKTSRRSLNLPFCEMRRISCIKMRGGSCFLVFQAHFQSQDKSVFQTSQHIWMSAPWSRTSPCTSCVSDVHPNLKVVHDRCDPLENHLD
jgi:hypothetical protein